MWLKQLVKLPNSMEITHLDSLFFSFFFYFFIKDRPGFPRGILKVVRYMIFIIISFIYHHKLGFYTVYLILPSRLLGSFVSKWKTHSRYFDAGHLFFPTSERGVSRLLYGKLQHLPLFWKVKDPAFPVLLCPPTSTSAEPS